MDWALGRTVGRAMNGAVIGASSLTDFHYANDVALLAELIALLQSTLEIFSQEAAPLGLQVNWAKTKIQSLSDFLPKPDPLTIEGEAVEAVDSFVYLGSLVDTSCRSSPEIRRRIGIARQTFKDLERGLQAHPRYKTSYLQCLGDCRLAVCWRDLDHDGCRL